jgi:hypothetical protein
MKFSKVAFLVKSLWEQRQGLQKRNLQIIGFQVMAVVWEELK